MDAGELKSALRMVWIVLSLVVLAILLTPWALSAAEIESIVPKCEWKRRFHKECFLCGMTTAFIEISRGRMGEAERSNRGSLPLYGAFVLNEGALVVFLRGRQARRGLGVCST